MLSSSIPWNAKQITKMIDNGTLTFDNAVQRGFVWDKARMSLLIDTMLRQGYPIPPFYVVKDGRTVQTPKGPVALLDALDGKQRNMTIYSFRKNEFKLVGLEPINTDDGPIDINGMTYETLPDELRDAFDSKSIICYMFSDATEEDITEIMRRLNNGKPLSAIDITRIKAADLPGLKSMGEHPLFTTYLSDKARDGHQQEDIIIKSYVLLTSENKSLDNKDIRPFYKTLTITGEIRERLTKIYDMLLEIIEYLQAEHKKTARKLTMKTHMISVVPFLDKGIQDGKTAEQLGACLAQFYDEGSPSTNDAYNAATRDGSNHAEKVKIRLDALDAEYEWYFNGVGNDEE